MLMWIIIMLGTIAIVFAAVVFLVTRIGKFHIIQKLSGVHKKKQHLLSSAILAAGALLVFFCMGLMNVFVVIIYLALFWLLGEGIAWLVRYFTKKNHETKCYFTGILVMIVTIIYLAYGFYHAHHVVVTEYTVSTTKQVEPLKIAMISDAHIGSTFDGEGFAQYVDEINALHPDVVVIAGDFIDGSSPSQEILKAIRCLERLDARYGTYFVFGNHDKNHYGEEQQRGLKTEEFLKALKASGVQVLEDEMAQLPGGYTIIGRRDQVEAEREKIQDLVQKAEPGNFIIDVNHQPNDYDNESAAGVDLVLSGHTHGGQFRLIRDVGVWIGANDKTYGYEKRGDTNFIVSSGISDWAIDFKTGCVSEIVVVTVRSQLRRTDK